MVSVDTRRAEALRAAYLSLLDRLPAGSTFDTFVEASRDWDCHPVDVDGKLVGAVLTLGPELHACILPAGFGRWLSRRVLRLVDAAVDCYGYAMTRAATAAGVAFVKRLGFLPTRLFPSVFLKVGHGV